MPVLKNIEELNHNQNSEHAVAEKIYEYMNNSGYSVESVMMLNGLYTSYKEELEVIRAIRFCKIEDMAKEINYISTYNADAIERRRDEQEMFCHNYDEKHCDCFLPNITKENCYCAIEKMKRAAAKTIRQTKEYKVWRKCVLKRDNDICQHCGAKKRLHAHHIKPFAKFPDDRFSVKNGITLCSKCHKAEHKKYGNSEHD